MKLPGEPEPAPVAVTDAVHAVYLGRKSGMIEVEGDEGGAKKRLFFAHGELHLPQANPIARKLRARLPQGAATATPGWPAAAGGEVRELMGRIAHLVHGWRDSAFTFFEGQQVLPADLVGPLPTAFLLMEWAVLDRGEAELMEELGGSSARLVGVGGGVPPAIAALLDPQETVLLTRLGEPVTLSDLVRQAGDDATATLRRLARLRAIGLLQRDRGPSASERAAPVPPEVLRRLSYRVESSLAAHPLLIGGEAHRTRLRDLLATAGGLTHYELLGVEDSATPEQVHEAYDRLARLVHPSHAEALGLAGREPALWLLFERATDAYLTLSDPNLRRRYDVKVGMRDPGPSPEARRREAERLAESYHRRAMTLLEAEDYHFAVELLKQAVLADPKAEYYVRLGDAQAKNPNWLRQAADSYHKALDLGYPDPAIWSALGRVCEAMGETEQARRHFQTALERRPGDADAAAGLARLDVLAAAEPSPRRRGFFGLFGRRR
jgi:hypothetical protein